MSNKGVSGYRLYIKPKVPQLYASLPKLYASVNQKARLMRLFCLFPLVIVTSHPKLAAMIGSRVLTFPGRQEQACEYVPKTTRSHGVLSLFDMFDGSLPHLSQESVVTVGGWGFRTTDSGLF